MSVLGGFEPGSNPAERRAQFDLRRRLNNLGVDAIVSLTQAEYDLLSPPDPDTLYIIIP